MKTVHEQVDDEDDDEEEKEDIIIDSLFCRSGGCKMF